MARGATEGGPPVDVAMQIVDRKDQWRRRHHLGRPAAPMHLFYEKHWNPERTNALLEADTN